MAMTEDRGVHHPHQTGCERHFGVDWLVEAVQGPGYLQVGESDEHPTDQPGDKKATGVVEVKQGGGCVAFDQDAVAREAEGECGGKGHGDQCAAGKDGGFADRSEVNAFFHVSGGVHGYWVKNWRGTNGGWKEKECAAP
jgi:hypothetical protein